MTDYVENYIIFVSVNYKYKKFQEVQNVFLLHNMPNMFGTHSKKYS